MVDLSVVWEGRSFLYLATVSEGGNAHVVFSDVKTGEVLKRPVGKCRVVPTPYQIHTMKVPGTGEMLDLGDNTEVLSVVPTAEGGVVVCRKRVYFDV